MRYGAIIVAAGRSSRMGAFKPLLPLGDERMIHRVVRLLQTAAEEIVVVTGYRGEELKAQLSGTGVQVVENVWYQETGMFDSVCLGLRALDLRCDRFFVTPGDIPLVRPDTLLQMQAVSSTVVRPRYQGVSGHPILLSCACARPLLTYAGQGGLRGAIQALGFLLQEVETDDPGILMDADTPEDYQALCHYLQTAAYGTAWRAQNQAGALIPDEAEIQHLGVLHGTAVPVRLHAQAVCQTALGMAECLETKGFFLDRALLRSAVLLHDLCRAEKNHPAVAGCCLRELGYEHLAQIVELHHGGAFAPELDEAQLLFLADKHIQGTREVSLDKHFADSLPKCHTPEARAAHAQRARQAVEIQARYDCALALGGKR